VLISSTYVVSAQQTQASKYIAFRDDDVKPFTPLDTLKAVNQVHIDENVPVTLGIIPHPREAQDGNQLLQDAQFLTYMQSIAPNPLFEFAQHGYTHKSDSLSIAPSEFTGRSYKDQYNRISKGRADLIEAFGMVPKTFIPPFDAGDNNTLLATSALGFTEYSTYSASYAQHGYVNQMRTDGGIEMGAVNETEFSTSVQRAENISQQFLNDPQSDDMLVVTYHVWAFQDSSGAMDQHRIQELTDFINLLKARGALFTRLDRELVSASNTSPPTNTSLVLTFQAAGSWLRATGKEKNLSTVLLIESLGVVLSGIYVSARRQGRINRRTK
jgi:peptidoglycan/xylan/chitin deacetylase (PgdA/CDA1 family)